MKFYVPYEAEGETIRNECTLIHFSADATGAVAGVDAVAVATTAVLVAITEAVTAFFTASKTLSST